jgi:hypothetical protein
MWADFPRVHTVCIKLNRVIETKGEDGKNEDAAQPFWGGK